MDYKRWVFELVIIGEVGFSAHVYIRFDVILNQFVRNVALHGLNVL